MSQAANFDHFNLRHLRYFLMVCRAGSFRGASENLHVAQSAVSRRVADLERIFGVRLFERTARGVVLSGAGIALRSGALAIIAEIEAANATLARYAEGAEGVLRVAFFGTTSRLGFVPELITRFRSEYPNIRFEFIPHASGGVDPAELAQLDVVLAENGPLPAGYRSYLLAGGEYMLALSSEHPLTALPDVAFSVLCEQELIGFPRYSNAPAYDRLISAASANAQRLTIIDEQESECSRLAFAAAGMGIALVSPLAHHHDQEFDVEYRSISDFALPFSLWLGVRDGAPGFADPLARLARELLGSMSLLGSRSALTESRSAP